MDSIDTASGGTHPPTLNYDVLLNVVAQSGSRRTGLAIMHTCRVLYYNGARILLRDPVHLSTERGLLSFLYFLRGAPQSRPRHVRELSLHMSDIQPRLAQLFGRVCTCMKGLESLTMTSPERLLGSDPALVVGLAKLKSLTHLSLSDSGEQACTLLRLLQAPLKTVLLSWGYAAGKFYWETIDEDDWPELHPTILLENFAGTLEELTCQWWHTCEDYIRPRKTFPRLQHLIIEEVGMFYVAPYVQAFPNLARISVHSCNDENTFHDEVDENVEDNHELNVARQSLPASVHGGTWERMQEFQGSFVDFYIFGLACHIPRLILNANCSTASGYLPFLGETLSHTTPAYLDFTTRSDDECDGLKWLSTALRDMNIEARSRLKTLAVGFTFESSRDVPDLAAAMEDFASAVERTYVDGLQLTIVSYTPFHITRDLDDSWTAAWNCSYDQGYDDADWDSDEESARVVPMSSSRNEQDEVRAPRKSPPPLTAEEQMVEDFDVAAYTKGLVETLPSLRDVVVIVERPRNRGRRVATLTCDGSRIVECLEYDQ
ncbi:hypothetical protein K466DRAFT_145123 [Polyporus arcularius HHB13444]|uniref:F-box domain-containing protein n=1 Tax=Polyporus arcularius HHB13444 TaxID=1314778 RepID=A0A5C3PUJ1_9APHY|nr:hypothetical protein K466DRAFT_145123 [Polyporus arcularius HHB13444]